MTWLSWFVYNAVLHIGIFLAVPFLLMGLITATGRGRILQRFGRRHAERVSSAGRGHTVWFHAASAGEATSLLPITAALHLEDPSLSLTVSTMTEAGQTVLRTHAHAPLEQFLAPCDLSWAVGPVVSRVRPRLLVLTETELWPNMIESAHRAGSKVILINGRISLRSFPRYRMVRSLLEPTLRLIDGFGMTSEADAWRLMELGANPDRLFILGHSKFDQDWSQTVSGRAMLPSIRRIAKGRRVVVCGSTHDSEEAACLDAMMVVWRRWPKALCVLAPRHLDRLAEVEALLQARRIPWIRRSTVLHASSPQVLLIDTVGELPLWYSVADCAFVGGTLAPVGGHNVLEPAAWGKPVIFGPHLDQIQHVADALEAVGGGIRVHSTEELTTAWLRLLASQSERIRRGEAAKNVLEDQRGSTDRTVRFILDYLS